MALSSSNVSKLSVRRSGRELGISAQALAIVLCAATGGWAEKTANSSNVWTALRAQIEEREKSEKSFEVRFEERVVDTERDPRVSDYVGRWIVLMSGDRQIHVEEEAPGLSAIDKKPYLTKRIVISNASVHKSFYPNDGNVYPGGYVDKEDDTSLYTHIGILPIAIRFRMLEWMAASCPGLSNDQVSTRTGTIDGKPCVIASWTARGILREIYLDATRDAVPLRFTVNKPKKFDAQWDLQYSVDDAGFVLRGWKFVRSDAKGHIVHARTAKVLQWNVNRNIDDSTFDIQFPVGTYITDRVTGENYILKEDARKRHVSAKEWASGATYETLLHSEPKVEDGASRYSSLLLCGTVAAVFILSVVVVRKRIGPH